MKFVKQDLSSDFLKDSYSVSHSQDPGLGVRIIGEVTAEKVRIVQDADAIYREEIENAGLDKTIGQYLQHLRI